MRYKQQRAKAGRYVGPFNGPAKPQHARI
jgi:hypothetical protein